MPWVLFVGLTSAAFCSWFWLIRSASAVLASAPKPASMPPLVAHIVFSCRDDDLVTLDCVVDGDGRPFTIVAELPTTQEWASLAASDVLDEWAADGRAVAVDIVDGAAGASVRLSDDATKLHLGIAA